jgi:hypothetical protein
MLTEQRKTSPAAYKRATVLLVTALCYGVAATARHLGQHVHRLRRWQQEYPAHTPAACPGTGPLRPAPAALHQRRDEGKRRRMGRDIVNHALRF